MSMSRILHVLCLAAVLGGCAASTEPTDGLVESSEQALKGGGGGRTSLGYACSGLRCTCTGDIDCNDMFSDGVCGDIATCDDTDPLNPHCECLVLLRVNRGRAALTIASPTAASVK